MTSTFIDYLNEYQKNKSNTYSENINFILAVNKDYAENQYYNPGFVGDSFYYTYFARSLWNEAPITNDYDLWKMKHEITTMALEPKEKIFIHASIQTIGDLLTIINENVYRPEIEYNIDLKSMHNIKDELIQLDKMIGMDSLKKSVLDQLLYFVQDLHLGKNVSEFKHTVIYGSPGTGKTEVAKMIGSMYSKLGILKNNVFKKVTRGDLIAGYLGQTAIKTRKVIEECNGGVLFIDEAYSLGHYNNDDSFAKECIDTLCEALSDKKDDLMVIVAGYEEEMKELFFKTNKGLESRFIWRFKMEAYTAKEMMLIFKKKVEENEWLFETENVATEKWFEDKKDHFKNFGRDMEMLLSYTKIVHSRRIYGKEKALRKQISIEDMQKGYDMFIANKTTPNPKQDFMHSIYI